MAFLRRTCDGEKFLLHPYPSPGITIGRSEKKIDMRDHIVVPNNMYISSHHVNIFQEVGGEWILETVSSNGTCINNIKSRPKEVVQNGDIITLAVSQKLPPGEKAKNNQTTKNSFIFCCSDTQPPNPSINNNMSDPQITELKNHLTKLIKNYTCGVCLEEMSDTWILPECSHVCCIECVSRLQACQNSNIKGIKCPFCKVISSTSHVLPVMNNLLNELISCQSLFSETKNKIEAKKKMISNAQDFVRNQESDQKSNDYQYSSSLSTATTTSPTAVTLSAAPIWEIFPKIYVKWDRELIETFKSTLLSHKSFLERRKILEFTGLNPQWINNTTTTRNQLSTAVENLGINVNSPNENLKEILLKYYLGGDSVYNNIFCK
eukprot:TRINITY_DN5369_c0_g1_i1.p1 TRINITY_DN5369_c0_g1~~TRINITY_DN5369_c0_g1_i1.p1  ORF type:complete len:377 (-),score=59.47 TRINITY_DN5369_c0_g1_i1:1100-2230(-)